MVHPSPPRRPLLAVIVIAALLLGAPALTSQVLAPNLLYTSIKPCRVFDTRIATNGINGRLHAGVAQTFNVVGGNLTATTFTGQGGHNGGCSITATGGAPDVQAVVFNFVAVGAAGPGDLLAWPTDQAQPTASILNYANAAALGFLNIANGIVLPVRQDVTGGDITLKAQVSDTDAVADVVGYFSTYSVAQGGGGINLFLGRAGPGAAGGFFNVGIGDAALSAAATGSNNTAIGTGALSSSTADNNTAVGSSALGFATTGRYNTAVGWNAGSSETSGERNTALGGAALSNLVSGHDNLALGVNAGLNYNGAESGNIALLASGTSGESDVIRIGTVGQQTAAVIAGVDGATSAGGTAVLINVAGRLGTTTSSLRFKEDVADMGAASADLMRLRPVTFHYKPAYDDGSRLLQYGLIAEEVAQIYPGLVQYGRDGEPQAVRYHFINAMLLNEAQKQHARIAEQAAEIARQRDRLAVQHARVDDLEARLARVEASGVFPSLGSGTALPAIALSQIQKPAPGTAINWCHPLSAGLVSAVPLNEGSGATFHDAVSQQPYQARTLSGTPSGALPPAWFTPPVSADYPWVGPAISNDGATAQAIQSTLQESDLIKNVTAGYSYAVLVQPLDTVTFGRIMDATGSAVITIYLNVQPGKVATTWRDAAGGAIVPMAPFTVNQWILVLCTVQQGRGVMYVNGAQVASSANVDLAQSWAHQAGLLVYNATGNGAMMANANFSSWWIWNNRVLTAQEAADMYANPWGMLNGSGAGAGCAFYPVPPCRAADTRNPAGTLGGPSLAPNGTRSFPIGGQCGIPAGAAAVSTNVTAVAPAAAGYLSVFPAGAAPGTSTLDFSAGQTRANNAVVSLRAGAVDVANGSSGALDLIVDVNGYFK